MKLRLLFALALFPQLQAQTMPQDNWRYDGLQFSANGGSFTLGSIAIGSAGVFIEVASSPLTIQQFTENGVFVRSIAHGFGGSPNIAGMACDPAGNLYVLDSVSRKVRKFNGSGVDQGINNWGGSGTADGLFGTMNGSAMITVDKDGLIYVADPGNQRVQVFNSSGTFVRKWGTPGSLPGQFPAGSPTSIAAGPNGEIYAAGSSLVRVFDGLGAFIRSATFNSNQIAVAPDGVIVGENGAVLDPALASVGSLPSASQIALNSRGDFYLVAATSVSVYEREYSGVQNSLLPPAIPLPAVLAVSQRPGTTYLDVDYKVTDADSATVTTAAAAFINGGNTLASIVPMKTFVEGTAANIGTNVPTGVTKRITWDMAADWSADFAQIQAEVMTKDSRNPLGIHWITLPEEGGNPAIQVSKAPVSDEQLRSLWFWFLATGHPDFTKANGASTLTGAGNGYAGQILATDSGNNVSPTASGLAAAYQEIGVRGITQDEITRALAGSYGFSSVNFRSVVRNLVAPAQVVVGWGYSSAVPPAVQADTATKVMAYPGGGNYLALKSNGTVVAWSAGNVLTTVPAGLSGVLDIAVGLDHYLALKADGTVVAWGGSNPFGELTIPPGLSNVTAIAAGEYFNVARKSDGTVVAWGRNSSSQVSGATGKTDIAQVVCGRQHCLARKSDGTLVAWGDSGSGQGVVHASLTGVSVKSIAAGLSHNLVILQDDTVFAWGANGSGQCSPLPGALAGSTVVSIAGGNDHSIAATSSGAVVAWGSNASGQTTIPAGVTGVTKVAAGNGSSLVIRSNP